MPIDPDARETRRQAVKTLNGLGGRMSKPLRIDRDAGSEAVTAFVNKLWPLLDTPEEFQDANGALAEYNASTGADIMVPQLVAPDDSEERKLQRREAVKMFSRLGSSLDTPLRLNRDAGQEVVCDFIRVLFPALDSEEELHVAQQALDKYNTATGSQINVPPPAPRFPLSDDVLEAIAAIPVAPDTDPTSGDASKFRVHCCDVNLTFNGDFVLPGETVADWWPRGGIMLVQRFFAPQL